VSKDGIYELDRKRVIVSIPKNEIKNIKLQFGSKAEKPFTQAFLSIILIGLGIKIGIIPLFKFVHDIIANPGLNNQTSSPYVAAFIFLGSIWVPIGFAFLIAVFQNRYFLLIDTIKGRRKIIFKEKIEKEKVDQFIEKINIKHGYSIN
jgi:hypothetical protein